MNGRIIISGIINYLLFNFVFNVCFLITNTFLGRIRILDMVPFGASLIAAVTSCEFVSGKFGLDEKSKAKSYMIVSIGLIIFNLIIWINPLDSFVPYRFLCVIGILWTIANAKELKG